MLFGWRPDFGGGSSTNPTPGPPQHEEEIFNVPPIPEEEDYAALEAPSLRPRKPKWNYPPTTPQPPPTGTTSGTGIPCVWVNFEGGLCNHASWGTVTLTPSGLTEEQKQQALAVAQSYFPGLQLIITTDKFVFDNSGIRIQTFVTQNAWYNGTQFGGVTWTGCIWWFNDCPNFVYSSKLAMHPRYIGQVIAHELGHALGLGHRYNPQGGLLSCDVMGNPLECNPATWNPADFSYLQNKL